MKVENRLLSWKERAKVKRVVRAEAVSTERDVECTFAPKINSVVGRRKSAEHIEKRCMSA